MFAEFPCVISSFITIYVFIAKYLLLSSLVNKSYIPVAPGAKPYGSRDICDVTKGPGKPVAPVKPIAPVAPVTPVAPVSPAPVGPVTPVVPVAPVIPIGPTIVIFASLLQVDVNVSEIF